MTLSFECQFIHSFAFGIEIPLSTIDWNLSRTWIMAIMRLKHRPLWFLEGNITILVTKTCIAKTVSFTSRNQRILSSSLIIIIENTLTVKVLSKPELGQTKEWLYLCLRDIPTSHNLLWWYWRWLPSVMYQYLRLGSKGSRESVKAYSQCCWPLVRLKKVKQFCHD